jgi:hypothetical protein
MKAKPLDWQYNTAQSIFGLYIITSNNNKEFYLKFQQPTFRKDEYIFIDSFYSLNSSKEYAQKLHEFQLSLLTTKFLYDHNN